jgi:hypothetical protein
MIDRGHGKLPKQKLDTCWHFYIVCRQLEMSFKAVNFLHGDLQI